MYLVIPEPGVRRSSALSKYFILCALLNLIVPFMRDVQGVLKLGFARLLTILNCRGVDI
jgi:hypothetical protein